MQAARGASLSDDSPHPEPDGTAAPARRRFGLFACVLAVALALDQVTKWLAVEHLTDQPPRPLLGEFLQLYLTYNPGAAFSLGKDHTWVFTILASVAITVVLAMGWRARTRTWGWALGLIGGGILGNLVDRVLRPPKTFQGHVVDFLMLPNWPVFNVADICLNLGVGLIILLAFRGTRLDGTKERDHAAARSAALPKSGESA